MFISLLPMMLQQAASLSYDVLNYVSIACFFVFFVNLIKDRKFTNKVSTAYIVNFSFTQRKQIICFYCHS